MDFPVPADPDYVRNMGMHLLRDDVFPIGLIRNDERYDHDQFAPGDPNYRRGSQRMRHTRTAQFYQSDIPDQSEIPRLSANETGFAIDLLEDPASRALNKDSSKLRRDIQSLADRQRHTHRPEPFEARNDENRDPIKARTGDDFRGRANEILGRFRIGAGGIEYEDKDSYARPTQGLDQYELAKRRDDARFKATKQNVSRGFRDVQVPLSASQAAVLESHQAQDVQTRVHFSAPSDIRPSNDPRLDDSSRCDERYMKNMMTYVMNDATQRDHDDDADHYLEVISRARRWSNSMIAPTSSNVTADDRHYETEVRTKNISQRLLADTVIDTRQALPSSHLLDERQARSNATRDLADFETQLGKFINTIHQQENYRTRGQAIAPLSDDLESNKLVRQTMEQMEVRQAPAPFLRTITELGDTLQRHERIDEQTRVDEVYNSARDQLQLSDFERSKLMERYYTEVSNLPSSEGGNRGLQLTAIDQLQSRGRLDERKK